ncbi:MAG: hypothetical protein HQ546_02470 [Planctomycetes bacterium]|nr:hypothetical protein [Planctomycetota bacterium]
MLDAGPVGDALTAEPSRTVEFAGMQWYVKSGQQLGPGPNAFSDSDESVWVDEQGLHLKIRYEAGTWYCAEVYSTQPTQYGMHRFFLDARPDMLDRNVVLGMFLYEDGGKEFDVELSKWSQPDGQFNSQFVVQPWDSPGNIERYYTTLNGAYSTCYFDWQADAITFKSFHDHSDEPLTAGHLIHEWTYTGSDIPSEQDNLRIHMNLWLNYGLPPTDAQETEIVIKALDLPNYPPTIGLLTAGPEWLISGEDLTLTAWDVHDTGGEVTAVEFYHDANGNGVAEPAEKLGEDIDGSDGWSWTGQAGWASAEHAFMARAIDNDATVSPWARATARVAGVPEVSIVIGTGELAQAKSVTFTDPDGTRAKITLKRGSATLRFTQEALGYDMTSGGLVIHTAAVTLTDIVLDDVSVKSSLLFKARGGDGIIEVGRITGSTALGSLKGKNVDLTGAGICMTGDGSIGKLRLHDLCDGADILLPGQAHGRGMTMRFNAANEGSVIDVLQGPIRSIRFTGAFQAVFTAGVTAGQDGQWFTEDDEVVNVVPIGRVRLAKRSTLQADVGQPWGLLLGPGVRRINTALYDKANNGSCVDGDGFEAWVLPGPTAGIGINDRVYGTSQARRVRGQVSGVANPFYKVILYAKTDHWYIQPLDAAMLKLSSQGRWRTSGVKAGELYAYLVRADFQPPEELWDLLEIDGREVVALDVWSS